MILCGVDEAGRGPLAGPVFAAAVVLDASQPIDGLRDSKQLSARQRESLAVLIRQRATDWSIAEASVAEIDALNILQATMLAMQRAVAGLREPPALALVDGNRAPRLDIPVRTLVGGDRREPAISAASILAKTARDARMLAIHQQYPAFGFDRHKGYPSPAHREVLARLGPCEHHRRSFAPVREAMGRDGAAD